jgi:hypothetical protein
MWDDATSMRATKRCLASITMRWLVCLPANRSAGHCHTSCGSNALALACSGTSTRVDSHRLRNSSDLGCFSSVIWGAACTGRPIRHKASAVAKQRTHHAVSQAFAKSLCGLWHSTSMGTINCVLNHTLLITRRDSLCLLRELLQYFFAITSKVV